MLLRTILVRLAWLLPHVLLASTTWGAGFEMFPLGTNTGEKPQSKIWHHDGAYWAILDGPDGLAFYEKKGESWSRGQFTDAILTTGGGAADVKWNGTRLYVLVYDSSAELFEYSYDSSIRSWVLLPGFPVSVPDPSGSETLVLEEDSTGRLWVTAEGGRNILVYYTTGGHQSWSSEPLVVREGVDSDDISSVVSFGGNKIGVFWSDQKRDEFGFRVHHDHADPGVWDPVEVVYAGSGHADDHLNLACDSTGRVYAITKDGSDRLQVHRRDASGLWSTAEDIADGEGTRGVILVDETENLLYALYTSWDASRDRIEYRTASPDSLLFGDAVEFISTSSAVNDVTGMKQILPPGSLVAIATRGDRDAWWNGFGDPPPLGPQPAEHLAAELLGTPARVELAWQEPSTGSPTGYHVERMEFGLGFVRITGDLVSGTSFTDAAPPENVLCYRVVAAFEGEEAPPSNTDCIDNTPNLPPDPPTVLSAFPTDLLGASAILDLRFDEGSDQIANDFSGLGHHGRLGEGPHPDSHDPVWTTGFVGGALEFDGTDDIVRIRESSSLHPTDSFTVETWIRPDARQAGEVLGKGTGIRLAVTSSLGLEFSWVNESGELQAIATGAALDLDTWHHVAGVFDAKSRENRIYVDGTLAASSDAMGLPSANDDPLRVGADPGGRTPFRGALDEIRLVATSLYDEPFSPSTSASSPTRVRLFWQPAFTGVRSLGFNVYRSVDGGPYALRNPAPLEHTAFLDDVPGGEICYYVTGVSSRAIESASSPIACHSVDGALPAPPLAPPVSAELAGTIPTVTIQWSAPPGGLTPTAYHLYRAVEDEPAVRVTTTPIVDFQYSEPAPTLGRICYRVRGVDGFGREGPASAEACVSNLPPLPPTPRNVAATPGESPQSGRAAFAMDEGTGQALLDATGSATSAHLGPTPSVEPEDPTWGPGMVGSALVFDGTDDYVLVPDSPALRIAGSFTVEAWVRVDGEGDRCVLAKGNRQERNYVVLVLADGGIQFRWETAGGDNHGSTAEGAISDTDWHHVACVYDLEEGENRIYLDGTLVLGEPDSGVPTTSEDPLILGARESGSRKSDPFSGSIDLVRVSAEALYTSNFPAPTAYLENGSPLVAITWDALGDGAAAHYNVYRSVDGAPFILWNPSPVHETVFFDTEPAPRERCYRVGAVDEFGQESALSPPSCVEGTIPTAVAGFGARAALRLHPNPMNGTGTIVFQLSRRVPVSLTLYDVSGRRVRTLLDEPRPAGLQQLRWSDLSDGRITSGVYFLVLDAGDRVERRKITIVR